MPRLRASLSALTRAAYEHECGTGYKRPGLRHKILACAVANRPSIRSVQSLSPSSRRPLNGATGSWTASEDRRILPDAGRRCVAVAAVTPESQLRHRRADQTWRVFAGDKTYARARQRLAKQSDGAAGSAPSWLRSAGVLRRSAAAIETKKHRKEWTEPHSAISSSSTRGPLTQNAHVCAQICTRTTKR